MKAMILFLLLYFPVTVFSQYTKEKISNILTGGSAKTWSVSGVNTEQEEKLMTFSKNNSVIVVDMKDKSKSEKWSLASADNIRWFITIGKDKNELIISYDKKGTQYVKLTKKPDEKVSGYYEIKLLPANEQ